MRSYALVCVLLLGLGSGLASAASVTEPAAKPALELPDLDGHTHRLAEWNGKVVLVNFWATWCAPCQSEVRNLMRYQRQYGPKGLQILGVGLDDPAKLRNFRDTVEMNYPVLRADPDGSMELLAAWGNRTGVVPYTVVLDIEGRVVERVTGVVDDDVMEDIVVPHLGGAARPGIGEKGLRTSLGDSGSAARPFTAP